MAGQTDIFGNPILSNDGGMGTAGWVVGTNGKPIGLSSEALAQIKTASGNNPNGFVYGDNKGLSYGGLGGNRSINWMGKGGYLDTAATGIQALSAGVGAWNGFQDMKLAKDKFAFEKASANRNIANQGLAYNTELDRRRNVGLAMATDAMSAAARNSYKAHTQALHANTSAIG